MPTLFCSYNGCNPTPFTPYIPFITAGISIIITAITLLLLLKFKKISLSLTAGIWSTLLTTAIITSFIITLQDIRQPPICLWTTDQQYRAQFGDIYAFAHQARQALPEGCQASYVSDLLPTSSAGISTRDHLKYFIYPINIPVAMDTRPSDCIVAFQKVHPENAIPNGYRIILRYKDNALLAVKQ